MTTELKTTQIDQIVKWWWTAWMGLCWGFRRHAVVYWACTGRISPWEAYRVLGIQSLHPLDIVIFYRELAVHQVPEYDLARKIVEMTPKPEREQLARFFAGRMTFEVGEGAVRSIAQLIDDVTVPEGIPKLRLTDDGPSSRIASSRMVFDGLRRTYSMRGDNPPREKGTTPLLFISSDCPELISVLPTLISDPKSPEDVMQTGTMQDSVWEACKNVYRDYLSVRDSAPLAVLRQEAMDAATDPTGRYMNLIRFDAEHSRQERRPRKR